jgi:hypothetical protein
VQHECMAISSRSCSKRCHFPIWQRMKSAGMCRTDFQMLGGYFKDYHPLTFPMTPGHEIARDRGKDRCPRTQDRGLNILETVRSRRTVKEGRPRQIKVRPI